MCEPSLAVSAEHSLKSVLQTQVYFQLKSFLLSLTQLYFFVVKLCHVKLEPETFRSCSSLVWFGLDSIVILSSDETSQCLIVSTSAATEQTFLPGFIAAVQVRKNELN